MSHNIGMEKKRGRGSNRFSKGQILLMGGKAMEAIAPLERVIEMAPERIDTRTSLVDAYRKAGMEDMARLQEEKLAAVKKEQAEKEAGKKDNVP